MHRHAKSALRGLLERLVAPDEPLGGAWVEELTQLERRVAARLRQQESRQDGRQEGAEPYAAAEAARVAAVERAVRHELLSALQAGLARRPVLTASHTQKRTAGAGMHAHRLTRAARRRAATDARARCKGGGGVGALRPRTATHPPRRQPSAGLSPLRWAASTAVQSAWRLIALIGVRAELVRYDCRRSVYLAQLRTYAGIHTRSSARTPIEYARYDRRMIVPGICI